MHCCEYVHFRHIDEVIVDINRCLWTVRIAVPSMTTNLKRLYDGDSIALLPYSVSNFFLYLVYNESSSIRFCNAYYAALPLL